MNADNRGSKPSIVNIGVHQHLSAVAFCGMPMGSAFVKLYQP
jgi:hypothetical protein